MIFFFCRPKTRLSGGQRWRMTVGDSGGWQLEDLGQVDRVES